MKKSSFVFVALTILNSLFGVSCATSAQITNPHDAKWLDESMIASLDTLKRVDEEGFILATPPRHMLRAAQTPQCFWAEEIKALHLAVEKENLVFTDDAALYEYGGKRVRMVDGAIMTKKLTIQDDLMWVEQMKKVWEDQK